MSKAGFLSGKQQSTLALIRDLSFIPVYYYLTGKPTTFCFTTSQLVGLKVFQNEIT